MISTKRLYRREGGNPVPDRNPFPASDPEGWWTLTVRGSGPLHAFAWMLRGEQRIVLPVERPATCGTGPVTRTGG